MKFQKWCKFDVLCQNSAILNVIHMYYSIYLPNWNTFLLTLKHVGSSTLHVHLAHMQCRHFSVFVEKYNKRWEGISNFSILYAHLLPSLLMAQWAIYIYEDSRKNKFEKLLNHLEFVILKKKVNLLLVIWQNKK